MKKLFKHIVYFILVTLPITFTGCSEENQKIPEYKEEDKVESPVDKPVATVDTEMNQAIDAYLSSHYLWNDEYKGMKSKDLAALVRERIQAKIDEVTESGREETTKTAV